MIRKLVRQMLTAQVFSALTVSLCLLIDSIMISRFLHEDGIAAYGLANPLLLAIGAIGTLLAAGIQVVCSRALGRGSQEEANAGYSSAIAVTLAISLTFTAAVVLFRNLLAQAMGAGDSGILFKYTADYLMGYSLGAPGSVGALVLVPFLQMAGQSKLLIAAVATMTVTDIGLDILNALVLKWGMFGMGLASALSYYAAMVVAMTYFLSRDSVFRFTRKGVSMSRIRELFRSGIPAGANMAASVILVFLMNRLLRALGAADGGTYLLAAYTVIMSIGNTANCITTGIGGVSLTLCGIFFHEEDRTALRESVKLLCIQGVFLGIAVGVLLIIFAPPLIGLFIAEAGPAQQAGILGLRLFAAGLIPCCINNALKYAYQGMGRNGLTVTISLLEGTVFPILAAFVLSRFIHATGAWLGFAVGEILMLLAAGLLILRKTGKKPWEDDAFLLLKRDFGAAKDQTLEMNITSMEEVAAAAQSAEQFCMERGQDERISKHISLCIEEMAGNVISHGFADDKGHHLSVRLLNKEDRWVLRFRDDCRAFNPVNYVPASNEDAIGIRLVMALAGEVHYTYSMNLNNLALILPKQDGRESAEVGQNA